MKTLQQRNKGTTALSRVFDRIRCHRMIPIYTIYLVGVYVTLTLFVWVVGGADVAEFQSSERRPRAGKSLPVMWAWWGFRRGAFVFVVLVYHIMIVFYDVYGGLCSESSR